MRTMSVPRKTPCLTQKGCKQGYLVFHRKRLEPRVLPWQQVGSRCDFVSFVMYISGAKFEDHCPIFLEIFLIQYFNVLVELFMTSSLPSFA